VHGAIDTSAIFAKLGIFRALTNPLAVKSWTATFPTSSTARALHVVAWTAANLAIPGVTISTLMDDAAVLQSLVTIMLINITVDSPPAGVTANLACLPQTALCHLTSHAEHLGQALRCLPVGNLQLLLRDWLNLENIGLATFSNNFQCHGGELVWGDPGGGLVCPPLGHLLLSSHKFSLLVKECSKPLHRENSGGNVLHVASVAFWMGLEQYTLGEVKDCF